MAANAPIRTADDFFTGEDKTLQWTIDDSTGAVVNITGWTIQFKLFDSEGGAVQVTKSASLSAPTGGVCTVALAAADTSGLTAGTHWYTLTRTNAGSNTVLAYGDFELRSR